MTLFPVQNYSCRYDPRHSNRLHEKVWFLDYRTGDGSPCTIRHRLELPIHNLDVNLRPAPPGGLAVRSSMLRAVDIPRNAWQLLKPLDFDEDVESSPQVASSRGMQGCYPRKLLSPQLPLRRRPLYNCEVCLSRELVDHQETCN